MAKISIVKYPKANSCKFVQESCTNYITQRDREWGFCGRTSYTTIQSFMVCSRCPLLSTRKEVLK